MQDELAKRNVRAEDVRRATEETEGLRAHLDNVEQQLQVATRDADVWRTERARLIDGERQALARKMTLETQLDELRRHLTWIENSTVFRVTRPLVNAKLALTGLLSGRPAVADVQVERMPVPAGVVVDVVVPVYKGLGDTQRCIRSVLASGCSAAFELVVINDASPEPEVTQWLRDLAAAEPRVLLLENAENLGFVGTVNRGMSIHPDRDVLLLNSDTEVANDWLDRLQRSAYSDRRVASVTPFSNNATICSYPRFCEANGLVAGLRQQAWTCFVLLPILEWRWMCHWRGLLHVCPSGLPE